MIVALLCWAACDDPTEDEPPPPAEMICAPAETRPCYTGPPGSDGAGICFGGVETCLPHGRGWSECAGEVVPAPEDCSTADVDENCDGLLTCGDTMWGRRYGGASDESVTRVDSDDAGRFYLAAVYRESFDLGGGPLPAPTDARHLLFAALDADGFHAWSVGVYSDAHLVPRDVAAARDGSFAVFCGDIDGGDVVIGGTTLVGVGGGDVLLVKIDGAGNLIWGKRYGSAGRQNVRGVALDAEGNVVIAGLFEGTIDFGGAEPLITAGLATDIFVAKLDPDGEEIWSRSFPGPLDQTPRSVAIDGDGRIVIGGSMGGTVDFGGGAQSAMGTALDVFVVALEADGTYAWSRLFGAEGGDELFAVATTDEREVVIAGRFQERVRFGASLLDAEAANAIFVSKLDPDGDPLWAERIGGSSNQDATDVAVDRRGRIVVTGYYEGDIDIGGTSLAPAGLGEPYILVAKLEPDGSPVWARGIAVDGNQAGAGAPRGWRTVAILPDDFIGLAGFAERDIDLGPSPSPSGEPGQWALPALGGNDMLIAKLAP